MVQDKRKYTGENIVRKKLTYHLKQGEFDGEGENIVKTVVKSQKKRNL